MNSTELIPALDSGRGVAGLPKQAPTRLMLAPAKVNLHLELLGKRADGYHELETLMVGVNLYDGLEVAESTDNQVSLTLERGAAPVGADNLVCKAAEAVRQVAGIERGVRLRLCKRIPSEAGLGGGSSDAAMTLLALNSLWKLGWSRDRLLQVAAGLGSDVGFFLEPTAAWCTGRGEVVEPVAVGGTFHFVVVKTALGCPTAEVYRRVRFADSGSDGKAALAALAAGDPIRLAKNLHNRLQAAALEFQPGLAEAIELLASCRPLATLLCGSGSAIFGLCSDRRDAIRVARTYLLARPNDQAFVLRNVRSP